MMEIENLNNTEYEQINQKINNSLFNELENQKNCIPLNSKEINRQIQKEFNPILNSLKNEVIVKINDIKNEIKYFKLKNYKFKEVKDNIIKGNNLINTIYNKTYILKEKNIILNNILNNHKKSEAQKNINLVLQKNILLNNYEIMNRDISSLINNQYKMNKNIENYNYKLYNRKKLLIKLNDKFQNIGKEKNEFSTIDNQEIFNKYEEKIKLMHDKIKEIENIIQEINIKADNYKAKEVYVSDILKIKSFISENKRIIFNDFNKNLDLINEENQNLEDNIKNNIDIINKYKNYNLRYQTSSKNIESEINNLKEILFKKSELEEKKEDFILIKDEIKNAINAENINKNKIEQINKKIDNTKKAFLNYIKAIEYSNYSNNLNQKMVNISNNINEKMIELIDKENTSNNLISNFVQNQKEKINNIEKESNNIKKEITNIQLFIDETKKNNIINMENIYKYQNRLSDVHNYFGKINLINDDLNKEKNELKEYNKKLNEIEKKIRNEQNENYECRNSVMKNINNCIYENNKNMNEIIKKGLLTKEKKNNLFIHLNDIERNILNNKKFLEDLIDNFIDNQKNINNRNIEDIKSIKNKANFNKNNDIIFERLINIENEIDIISGKYNLLIDTIGENRQKVQSKQNELLNFQKEFNKEIDNVKLYIDERINEYDGGYSNISNFNIYG